MPTFVDFSKFLMPDVNGTPRFLYRVKDQVARDAIAGGLNMLIVWDGNSVPVVANIPDIVSIRYNDTVYTGALPAANAEPMTFYLIHNDGEGNDNFAEYAPARRPGETVRWEKVGDVGGTELKNLGLLAYADSVDLHKGDGVNVIGENASLQAQDSTVSFGSIDKKNAIGTNATFNASGPTLNKTKKRIKSESVTGIDGTESKDVSISPSYKKMKRTSVTPAKSKSVSGSDFVNVTHKKLHTKEIRVPNGVERVDMVSDYTKRKLQTVTFPVTAPANTDPTVKGLDIRMYNASVHGSIEGADEETLVIMFGTTPTLTLSQNAPAHVATGSLVADGAEDTQAHTDYAAETGGEIVNGATKVQQPMVTSLDEETVADGTLDSAAVGDTNKMVGSLDLTPSVDLAAPDTAVDVATGELVAEGESGYNTAASGEGNKLMTGASGSVRVLKAASSKDVLVPTLQDINDELTDKPDVLVDVQHVGNYNVTVRDADTVGAITELGDATAAAQTVTFDYKDIKKVALFDDLKIHTESHPATRYLNFVAPNGGTISLVKTGEPTVVELETSLDGVNWTLWETDSNGNRSKTVAAWERLYVRNKSVTPTGFSLLDNGTVNVHYYKFNVPAETEVNGCLESLLCRTPEFGKVGSGGFQQLFAQQNIKGKPIIISNSLPAGCLYRLFYNTSSGSSLDSVEIRATGTTGNNATNNWLKGCADNGTIYCPESLELSSDTDSGVPAGWTRVDI